ncbi:glycosyltransferase family 4 protein [Pseudothermotoga sp.]|uniref:glycosyltransferase family 4 protein n=1 Tax=Pseudothermotoga sp. TaxID=2033661 RepID=UPI000E97129C|nr:glycosyltransferase family 4 protein [Pseudothermotoga sp.]HBJ80258.1 glycosyltransferase family 1 protein [Pseudothermotoga sp.]
MADKKALYVASIFRHFTAFHIPFMTMLQEMGFKVYAAACPKGQEREMEELKKIGVKTIEIPFSRNPYTFQNIKAYKALLDLFKRERFDLIHTHTPAASFITRFAAKKSGNQGPVIYTAHGFHFYKGAPLINWLLYYNIEKLAARWTDVLIVINQEDFEIAKKMGFIPEKNLFLVPGVGIDLQRFQFTQEDRINKRKELGFENNEVLFVYVAEFTRNKNHKMLLEAWKKVDADRLKAHLILVGDGSLLEKMKRKVKNEGIKNVHFLGYRTDVPEILHACDVAVSTSKREGLPRAILEAMACGKPVIATDVRGNRDLIEHFVNGILVTEKKELEQAVIDLAKDKRLRLRLGFKNKIKVTRYTVEEVAKMLRKIYEEIEKKEDEQ